MTKIDLLPGYAYMKDPWLVYIIRRSSCGAC